MTIYKFVIVLLMFTLTNCGFKVVDYSKLNDFNIIDIITKGENKINYKLKNSIKIISNDNSDRKIVINIFSESKNSIKEKNDKNEVTKYKVEINTKVKYEILNNNKSGNFEVLMSSNYLVDQKYSKTLKNQNQVIENLTQKISKKIKRELSKQLNDL